MSIKVFLGAGVTGGTPAYSLRYCIGVQETGTDQEKVEEAGSLFKFWWFKSKWVHKTVDIREYRFFEIDDELARIGAGATTSDR